MKMHPHTQSGFTLIEMIVSLGLFSVVLTISVGALLMLVATNQRLQTEQSIMTNLSFALDSMTREIRTGTQYNCEFSVTKSGVFAASANVDDVHGDATRDCVSGISPATNNYGGLSFKEGGDSITSNTMGSPERILYYFDKTQGKIIRKIGTSEAQVTSSGIYIKSFDIFVSSSAPLVSDPAREQEQAAVTIFIEAAETADPGQKSYFIQTTVSQRTLDL